MAYKFQVGDAILSGALTQEGSITVKDDAGGLQANIDRDTGDISSAGTGSFAGDMMIDGLMEVTGTTLLKDVLTVGDGITAVASDFNGVITVSGNAKPHDDNLYDLGTNSDKWRNLHVHQIDATGITGSLSNALTEGNGIQSFRYDGAFAQTVAISGSSAFDLANSDLRLSSSVAGQGLSLGGQVLTAEIDDRSFQFISNEIALSGNVAGDAIGLTAGVLDVKIDTRSFDFVSDAIALSSSVAGDGISLSSGVLAVDSAELSSSVFSDATINVAADAMVFLDANGAVVASDRLTDYAAAAAGTGLSASNGQFAVDLDELPADSVNVAADIFVFVDTSTPDNRSTKISMVDYAIALAGDGLVADNGQIKVAGAGAPTGIGDANATLDEGFNYGNQTLTANRTWALPTNDIVAGDIVRVKAGDLGGKKIIVALDPASTAGTGNIDGSLTSVEIESDYGAVSFMCIDDTTNGYKWRVF